MTPFQRLLGIVVLVALLFALNFSAAGVDSRPYPGQSEIASSPEEYDGRQVFVFADVRTVNQANGELTVRFENQAVVDIGIDGVTRESINRQAVTVDLDGATLAGSVAEGSYVQIYGELRDDATIIDADAVVVDYGGVSDYVYMYGMSVLGLFAAVSYFFKYWRVDWNAYCFEAREEW